MMHPLNCKEVTMRMVLGDQGPSTPWERFCMRFHFLICAICRRYERQLRFIAGAFKASIERDRQSVAFDSIHKNLLHRLESP